MFKVLVVLFIIKLYARTNICSIVVIFCLQMKGSDAKKTKIFTRDEVKQELIELMVINDAAETDELNRKAEEVQDLTEAADVIKQHEDIIRTKKKGTINIAFHQGKVFKSFKDKENFIILVTEFKVRKSTN